MATSHVKYIDILSVDCMATINANSFVHKQFDGDNHSQHEKGVRVISTTSDLYIKNLTDLGSIDPDLNLPSSCLLVDLIEKHVRFFLRPCLDYIQHTKNPIVKGATYMKALDDVAHLEGILRASRRGKVGWGDQLDQKLALFGKTKRGREANAHWLPTPTTTSCKSSIELLLEARIQAGFNDRHFQNEATPLSNINQLDQLVHGMYTFRDFIPKADSQDVSSCRPAVIVAVNPCGDPQHVIIAASKPKFNNFDALQDWAVRARQKRYLDAEYTAVYNFYQYRNTRGLPLRSTGLMEPAKKKAFQDEILEKWDRPLANLPKASAPFMHANATAAIYHSDQMTPRGRCWSCFQLWGFHVSHERAPLYDAVNYEGHEKVNSIGVCAEPLAYFQALRSAPEEHAAMVQRGVLPVVHSTKGSDRGHLSTQRGVASPSTQPAKKKTTASGLNPTTATGSSALKSRSGIIGSAAPKTTVAQTTPAPKPFKYKATDFPTFDPNANRNTTHTTNDDDDDDDEDDQKPVPEADNLEWKTQGPSRKKR